MHYLAVTSVVALTCWLLGGSFPTGRPLNPGPVAWRHRILRAPTRR